MLDFWTLGQFQFNAAQGIGDGEPFTEKDFICLAESEVSILRDFVSFEADFIDGPRLRWIAISKHERRDILHDLGTPTDDCHFPDPAKLMNCGEATYDDMIFNRHMASEGRYIGHNDVIAELNVMREMAIRQDMIA